MNKVRDIAKKEEEVDGLFGTKKKTMKDSTIKLVAFSICGFFSYFYPSIQMDYGKVAKITFLVRDSNILWILAFIGTAMIPALGLIGFHYLNKTFESEYFKVYVKKLLKMAVILLVVFIIIYFLIFI